jgi:hypothetical protein
VLGKCLGGSDCLVDLKRAELGGDDRDCAQHAHIGNAARQELLVRGDERLRPRIEERQQGMERKAGADPGEHQQRQVVRQHKHGDRRQRQHQATDVARLPALAAEIRLRVADDDPADEAHQHQHDVGQRVAAQADVHAD